MLVLEQQAGLLEQPLLARHLQVEHDMVGAQQIGDETSLERADYTRFSSTGIFFD